MKFKSDRQPGRLMTSLLAVALVVFTLAVPSASGSSAHACCKILSAVSKTTTVRCCMPTRPTPPQPAPPAQGPAVPVPDLAPVLPALAIPAAPIPATHALAQPLLLVSPPPIYLLNATLLV